MEWVGDENFIFMGFREYRFDGLGEDAELYSVGGSGLGVLRGLSEDSLSQSFHRLPRELKGMLSLPRAILLSKSRHESPVHRPVYMDFWVFINTMSRVSWSVNIDLLVF